MNHQSRNRDALLEYRVTVDTEPGDHARRAALAERAPVPQEPGPAVLGPGRRRARLDALPLAHLEAAGRRADRRDGRPPARRRARADRLAARLRRGARSTRRGRPTRPPDDPLYAVTPLLHEPDPKHISWSQSATGWNAPRGHRLRVTAAYDAERPHMRVMGIAHVYVARGAAARAPVRAAARRRASPRRAVRRPHRAAAGRPHARDARPRRHRAADRPPAGRIVRRSGDARVRVNHFAFSVPNLSIPRGSRITWRFGGEERHDATLASGPAGFASPSSYRGERWSRRFDDARRVPHLLLAAPGLHVAVRPGALTLRG